MARYKIGIIGSRRKSKRYDKKKTEDELEKIRLQNIEMLQRKPEKSNLKLVSNIKKIPIQPQKEEISIMDYGENFTEEELKEKLAVKKVKNEYEEPIDENNRKTEYKNSFEGEPYLIKSEEENIEILEKRLLYLTKRTMINTKEKAFNKLRRKMHNFIENINSQVKVNVKKFDLEETRKYYNKEFNFTSFKVKHLKKFRYPRINKRIYLNRIRKYFNSHKKKYVDHALDYDNVVFKALKRGNVRKNTDIDHNDYGTYDEYKEIKEIKTRLKN